MFNATAYLLPIFGGAMADHILGLRRSILFGGFLLVFAYLLLFLSDYTLAKAGDRYFIAAIALIPAANSLLIGTASGMISRIYQQHVSKAKAAMTYYYMAINLGGLLASLLAPILEGSSFGPLSVFALALIGKAIAALNFAYRYKLYDDISFGADIQAWSLRKMGQTTLYLLLVYGFVWMACLYPILFSKIISIGSVSGMLWFFINTRVLSQDSRRKQGVALLLTIESIVFFVIYNQMNTTLILFAQSHSANQFWGFKLSPAHYQVLNPLLILILGMQLPKLYQRFPRFSIPYQFASGTLLAGLALLLLAVAPSVQQDGMISPWFIALTYVLISLAELSVSAIGLSMIGLYCDPKNLGFAMGIWYLAGSLSNTISGRIAQWVAGPADSPHALQSLMHYQIYYRHIGLIACLMGALMLFGAYLLHARFEKIGRGSLIV